MRFSLPLLALTVVAQTPSFEVASIRPGASPSSGALICGPVFAKPGSLLNTESKQSAGTYTLASLIEDAYQTEVDDFDFPQWTRTGPLAVSVLIPPNTTVRTCRQMLQNLLAARFHMVTDVETREVARYHLRVSNSVLKLKPVNGPPSDPKTDVHAESGGFLFRGAPIARVAVAIEAVALLDARARSFRDTGSVNSFRIAMVNSVVDETGLTGYYDGEFKFNATASLRDPLAESIEDSVARQLGLTLELRRAPGKVLVIRSSDRTPTEN
jgi:uncharacterized protein (TIGR03435 family)